MKNSTITFVLLSLILLLFTAYFAAQNIIFDSGNLIDGQLNSIIQYVQEDKWMQAEETVDKLIDSWDKGKHLLSLNYAEEDYSLFVDNISKIQGAVMTKDKTQTVTQVLSALNLWNNFIKIVPEP